VSVLFRELKKGTEASFHGMVFLLHQKFKQPLHEFYFKNLFPELFALLKCPTCHTPGYLRDVSPVTIHSSLSSFSWFWVPPGCMTTPLKI